MSIKSDLETLQKQRNLERTAQYVCQNRHQREFFREYLDYQEENHLPNKATSFKQFIKHWETLGKQVPYSKEYLKSKMMHLLRALEGGARLSETM